MAVTLHEYVNELVAEIGNLLPFAKAQRAHQLAIFLPSLIAHYKLDDEITLSFIDMLFEKPIHEAASFIAQAPVLAKELQMVPDMGSNKAPPQRPARTQEQKDYHAAKMRGYRAKKKIAIELAMEALKNSQ